MNVLDSYAYAGLVDLISFIGTFVSTPMWFGLSVLQLLVIVFCVHFVIGICLGGISHSPRAYGNPDAYDRFSYASFRVLPDEKALTVTSDHVKDPWVQ